MAGTVHLSGSDLTSASREYRRHVAWLPQRVPTSRQLTAREYVAYVAWLKGESRPDAWDRAKTALDQVGLAEQAGRKTARLSGGQLRRVGIACALAHDARVILLDEPTAGLDPHQRTVFRDVLREVAAKTPVLMSTHGLADLAHLAHLADEADTVTLLDGGRVLHHGGTRSFLDHARPDAVPARRAESAYSVLMRPDGSQ
jgi:ABC-type multidrug transport system ATPase subunit